MLLSTVLLLLISTILTEAHLTQVRYHVKVMQGVTFIFPYLYVVSKSVHEVTLVPRTPCDNKFMITALWSTGSRSGGTIWTLGTFVGQERFR